MMKSLKSKNVPPVTNYLGFNLNEHGLETFNDSSTKSQNNQISTEIKEDTSKSIIPEFSCSTETIIFVSPEKCKPWKFADRLEQEMGNIDALGASISKHGQQEPALLRPAPNGKEENVEFEVIFGRRRWAACLKLGLKFKVSVKHLSDQEAAIAQKEENENREDISDYSRALYYKKLLDKNVFVSIAALSERMGIGKTTLTDLLSYTRINKDILASMPSPQKMSRASATKLATLSSKATPEELSLLMQLAPKIQDGIIPYRKIEDKLRSLQGKINQNNLPLNKRVYKSSSGKDLFSTKKTTKGEFLILVNKETAIILQDDELDNLIGKHLETRIKDMESG